MPEDLHRTGILLVNLGTPDAPEPAPVRRYLRQFLSDPRVIDINPVGRAALLYLVILPFRPARSAAAYQKVWTPEGSPLLVHGRALTERLRERIPEHPIELGMRYGNPSLASAVDRLREQQCDRLLVVPLYPHYAASSTGSTIEELARITGSLWTTPFVSIVPPFYDHPAFLDAFTTVAKAKLAEFEADHLLFSFHGLPERQVVRCADPSVCLASASCCETISAANRNCYRAQCHVTARELARALELGKEGEGWSIAFQSRLGRTPWIKPYTDEVVPALAKRGVRKLAVMCPAFVADCLETLEEIGMRAHEEFLAAGGEELQLVPSLNSHPAWVEDVEALIRERLPHAAPMA